jgi:hypothetical protein
VELLKTALVGLLGPAGIRFGWWLQQRDKKTDRQEKRRELLRNQAEEIYGEIDRVVAPSGAVVMWALDDISCGAEGPKPAPEIANRLKALLRMYFPASDPLLTDFERSVSDAMNAAHRRDEAIRLLPHDDQVLAMKKNHYEMVQEVHASIITLLRGTYSLMNKEVPALL